ncbi:methyltransferase domain-containing protein [Mycobacterium deserti]|uniref:Methyltransferase domain-containing protein n=1 Tax=Mycobacterium deserti TaxID=2978347 RepID=A0ABT2MC37_9MYCO|nr:methyltransferase domain-containing protein [Mycobacterium deserti]MCT7659838.1 methyltransferase domain-containing protein [Mycobacterium deserti]
MSGPEYVLGSDENEIARLQRQAAAIAEPTALLLRRGGVGPGMRVLDLGSGPGDVSFLVADIVGPHGSVVGLERDPAQLAVAERRLAERDSRNVSFRGGDARTFQDDLPFEAVVCRLLLMHLPDAADVVAHHTRHLRSGGVFVAVDYDMSGVRAEPPVGLLADVTRWIVEGFQYAKADPFVGIHLPLLLRDAGLTDVGSVGLQQYWPYDDPEAPELVTGVVRSLAPAIIASGAATAAELDIDTLASRIDAAVSAAGAVWTGPTVVGGWGRRG